VRATNKQATPKIESMPHLASLLQTALARGLPRIDAQMLLLHACGGDPQERAWLMAHDQDEASSAQLAAWQNYVQRRLQGEPVAYITGFKEFYGLRLKITPDVLDPRDDTETLVDWALELIPADRPFKVLDLGTGSGAVALAIAAQRPLAQVTATDTSAPALAVAQANATNLKLPVRFVQANARNANWLSCLDGEVFDLIVSNPPYIAEGDAHLPALKHEPAMALTSGQDGLDAIRSITAHAKSHLSAGGWLLMEHGYDQAVAIRGLLNARAFSTALTRQDLAGTDRCTGAQSSA
jgi:release factor glutamine methyltransferase